MKLLTRSIFLGLFILPICTFASTNCKNVDKMRCRERSGCIGIIKKETAKIKKTFGVEAQDTMHFYCDYTGDYEYNDKCYVTFHYGNTQIAGDFYC